MKNIRWKFLIFRKLSIATVLVVLFQNVPTLFVKIRFGRDFFFNCVDFHGGDDGIKIRAI
jgi:hypothetical protein